MIIQIPVVSAEINGEKYAIEFDADLITSTSIARGIEHRFDGSMVMDESVDLTFHFDDRENGPKWIKLTQNIDAES